MDFVIFPSICSLMTNTFLSQKREKKFQNVFEQLDKSINSQIVIMNSIGQGIEELKIGPIYSAGIYLSEALKEHRTLEERNENINLAKNSFIQGLGILEAKKTKQQNDFFQIALINAYIGFCWFLLEKQKDCEDWMNKSIENINQCLQPRRKDAGKMFSELQIYKQKIIKKSGEIHNCQRDANALLSQLAGDDLVVFKVLDKVGSKISKLDRELDNLQKEKERIEQKLIPIKKYIRNLSSIKENMESFLIID